VPLDNITVQIKSYSYRYDCFQVEDTVTIVIYLKNVAPESIAVQAGPRDVLKLNGIHIVFIL
jgi:hypothetical protein